MAQVWKVCTMRQPGSWRSASATGLVLAASLAPHSRGLFGLALLSRNRVGCAMSEDSFKQKKCLGLNRCAVSGATYRSVHITSKPPEKRKDDLTSHNGSHFALARVRVEPANNEHANPLESAEICSVECVFRTHLSQKLADIAFSVIGLSISSSILCQERPK